MHLFSRLAQPLPPTLGGRRNRVGGHPQTLGREGFLHTLGVSEFDIGDPGKEAVQVSRRHYVMLWEQVHADVDGLDPLES